MSRSSKSRRVVRADVLVKPIRAERGRVKATIAVSAVTTVLFAVLYFVNWSPLGPLGANLVQALIPNLIVVLIAFILVAAGKGLGLWQRGDKLDLIVEYLEEQRTTRGREIRLYKSPHEIAWNDVLDSAGALGFLCNFAVLPLRQGAQALRSSLDQHRAGHVFVFLNANDSKAVNRLAKSREGRDFADTPEGVKKAALESIALLLELLPLGTSDGRKPLAGIRVLLTSTPVPYASYWTSESVIVMGPESFPDGVVGNPRMVMSGESSMAMRVFNEAAIRSLVEEGVDEPNLNEMLDMASTVRSIEWLARMKRRLVQNS